MPTCVPSITKKISVTIRYPDGTWLPGTNSAAGKLSAITMIPERVKCTQYAHAVCKIQIVCDVIFLFLDQSFKQVIFFVLL